MGLTDSFEGDEFEVLRSKVVKLIRADLDNYNASKELSLPLLLTRENRLID